MAAPLVVAVVHLVVRVEILALQVKSAPPRDRRLWLRPAGRAMTKEIVTAAKAMGLMVHDHLVIGKGKHASFKSLGII
jgi:DNA repair protein RadC